MDSTTHCLEITDLSCARGDRTLFRGLTLRVEGGELFHVAGSNGSGKTTLLRTVSGLSRPADGEICWQGRPVRALGDEYRQSLAYVGHHDGVQGELTLTENLQVHRCLMDRSVPTGDVVQEALERLGLDPYRSFPAKILSQGQRRRLALARLLLSHKPLWILDEPFTALDVQSCRLISALLAQHVARGGMAVISSHQDFEIPRTTHSRIDLDALRVRGISPARVADAEDAVAAERGPA